MDPLAMAVAKADMPSSPIKFLLRLSQVRFPMAPMAPERATMPASPILLSPRLRNSSFPSDPMGTSTTISSSSLSNMSSRSSLVVSTDRSAVRSISRSSSSSSSSTTMRSLATPSSRPPCSSHLLARRAKKGADPGSAILLGPLQSRPEHLVKSVAASREREERRWLTVIQHADNQRIFVVARGVEEVGEQRESWPARPPWRGRPPSRQAAAVLTQAMLPKSPANPVANE
eukprot:2072475-Prymnesium_polylepis.3